MYNATDLTKMERGLNMNEQTMNALLTHTHITADEINRFHYFLRTSPVENADPAKKHNVRHEILSLLMCFTARLEITTTYDPENAMTVQNLMDQIQMQTGEEKSCIFLIQSLVTSGILKSTPPIAPGLDFDTETTYIFIAPERAAAYEELKKKAAQFDEKVTH